MINNEIRKLRYLLPIILTLTIVVCFAMIYLLTKPAIIKGFAISDKGQIGDTIGGIAGPIINLGGMILIFYSFKEQLVANINQQLALSDEVSRTSSSNTIQLLSSIYDELKNEIEAYSDSSGKSGYEAIGSYFEKLTNINYFSHLDNKNVRLRLINYNFSQAFEIIEKEKDTAIKNHFTPKFSLLYYWSVGIFFDKLYDTAINLANPKQFLENKMFIELREVNEFFHKVNNQLRLIDVDESLLSTMRSIRGLYSVR